MQTGSCLVPVISFGENNIFQVSRPEEKSFMATVQKYVQTHPAPTLQFCSTSYALLKCAVLQVHQCIMHDLVVISLPMPYVRPARSNIADRCTATSMT